MLAGKRILLGVTGGIASYKAVYLLRELQKNGAEVQVTMTPSATRFVGPETFSALSRKPAAIDVFSTDDPGTSWTRHIHLAESAALYVISPCTANTLAKLLRRLADYILRSIDLAARFPLVLSASLDGVLYEDAAVK